MRILLDSHILLWLAFDKRENLSQSAVDLLEDLQHELYFSLASLWEIAIKSALGKPDFEVDVQALREGLIEVGIRELPIEFSHILRSTVYPFVHKDPFDRILLAQAETEKMTFLTADKLILHYDKPFVLKAN